MRSFHFYEVSMTGATNPFDDSFEETKVSTNPFDDEGISSTNPFSEETFSSAAEGEAESVGDNIPPAEASWQYLGDLPYRRVPIYSNVQWDRRKEKSTDFFHHGLASFPPATIQHHPRMLDTREVRALLNTTTKTKVTGCPNGGPIAAVTVPIVGDANSGAFKRTEIRIFTNSGMTLSQFVFPTPNIDHRYSPKDILELGFTARTTLIVVLRDSLCLTYDLRGDPVLDPFYVFPPEEAHGNFSLIQASIYEGGVAVLANNKKCALVELLDDHDDLDYLQTAHMTARRVASNESSELFSSPDVVPPPHYALITHLPTAAHASTNFCDYVAIAVLPRSRTASRHPEVFLSTSDNSVIVVNTTTTEITDVDCRSRISSPIVDMCFAPNGRFLACFTESSMLTVISTSFTNKILDFDTSEGSASPPLAMKWCGEDSVVLHWKNLGVLMVGPYGDWLRFPYEGFETVHIIPEIDCCRVVTDSSVEILQRVPPVTASLLRIGSIETSAMLLDASDAFDAGAPSSDEAARSILKTGLLTEAIEACAEAATKEFDISMQKRLLRAASFGMHFSYKNSLEEDNAIMGGPIMGSEKESDVLPTYTTAFFVQSARKLRILNAMRNPKVGFILTSAQFDAITPSGVVARLIAMKMPALATSISKYSSLPKSVQLFARASKAAALVEYDDGRSDAETAEIAIRIVNGEPEGTSSKISSTTINRGGYATVAKAANKAGRLGVANLLLMLESSVADKVPALIANGSFADAIAVATAARDADFIFSTLMEYERHCLAPSPASDIAKGQSQFLNTVISKFTPEAFSTLRRYLETTPDVKGLTNLLVRAQRFTDAGSVIAIRAMGESDIREKQGMLLEASRIFGLGKDTVFQKLCTDDYIELVKDQEVLRTKYGSSDVAPTCSSVTETIASLIHFAASNVREQHKLLADVDKLAKKFRVTEKRLWHVKVKSFADSEQWANLRILADSRTKPPIGFKPFARAAIQGKQPVNEIMRYIDRVAVVEEKYDLFCEASLWKNALDEAMKLKDVRRVLNVKTLCNSQELQLLADEILGRLA